jgi:hypothetical protein
MEPRKILIALSAALPLSYPAVSAQETRELPSGAEAVRVIRVSKALERVADPEGESERGIIGVYLGEGQGKGAAINGLVPGGPAAEAGLRAGDRITALGDRRISGGEALRELFGERRPGEVVGVTVVRDGWSKCFELGLVAADSVAVETDEGGHDEVRVFGLGSADGEAHLENIGLGIDIEALEKDPEARKGLHLLHTLGKEGDLGDGDGAIWTLVQGRGDGEHADGETHEVQILVEAEGEPYGDLDGQLVFGLRAMAEGSDIDVEELVKKGLEFEWVPAGDEDPEADLFERVRRIYELRRDGACGEGSEGPDCGAQDRREEECEAAEGCEPRECGGAGGDSECGATDGERNCPVDRDGPDCHGGDEGPECPAGAGGSDCRGKGDGPDCRGDEGPQCPAGAGGSDCRGQGDGPDCHGGEGPECGSDGGERVWFEGGCPLAERFGARLDPRMLDRAHDVVQRHLRGVEVHLPRFLEGIGGSGGPHGEHHGERHGEHHGERQGEHHGERSGARRVSPPEGGEWLRRMAHVRTEAGRHIQGSIEELHEQVQRLSEELEELSRVVRRLRAAHAR